MVQNAVSLREDARISAEYSTFDRPVRAPEFCFASGSHVSSLRGDVAVEDLAVGDFIRMRSGAYAPIVELMRFHLPAERIAAAPELRPVTIRRNAVSEGVPRRDLRVTGGQVFESAYRLKLDHCVRSAAHIANSGNDDLHFTVFRLRDRGAVRVEHVWVEATPAVSVLLGSRGRPLLAD